MNRPSLPRFIILGTFTLLALVVVSERVISLWLQRKLARIAEDNRIGAESFSVNLYQRAVRVYNFDWQPADTSSRQIKIEKLTARGIDIIDLLRNNSLQMRSLTIENGNLPIKIHHKTDRDSSGTKQIKLRGLGVESLYLTNTTVLYSDSSTTWSGRVDLNLHHIVLKDPSRPMDAKSYDAGVRSISIRDIRMEPHHGFFAATIGRIDFDHEKDFLSCDSIHLIPLYPKVKFAHVRGTQSTWADVIVPRIEARGFDLNYHKDTTLTASHILIRDARVEAFRDRRVPMNKKSEVPMPMKWLREWGLAVEIDSIEIAGMNIVYEHISEDGFKPGELRFSNLSAVFSNVFNRSYDNTRAVTTLVSSSELMGGHIEAFFTFPLKAGVKYEARGKVTRLPLPRLNPMLENAAFVSIESGQLTELDFRFRYDNNMAIGEVTVDYQDLKIKGLKKDRGANENQVKTLVANTALKNNNRKTGPIDNERDKRRFIFHYWATSIMDGIRNAVVPVAAEAKKK